MKIDDDFKVQLGNFVLNPQYSNLLFLKLKVWALEYVPQEETENLNRVFQEKDLDAFMLLVEKYVPDLQTKITDLVKGV
jgi:hypothetical protein